MPKASEHKSSKFTRLLVMGPSGTGKTGGLLSLILGGYRVGVIDMDNGLDWLVNKLKKDHPDKIDNLEYMGPYRDKFKMTQAGPIYDGIPKAYTSAIQALAKWDDGTSPQTWGPERILALDSLTFFGQAAYNWKDALNPQVKDKRSIYGEAQGAVSDILNTITSDEFQTNVIVFTHVRWKTIIDEKGNAITVGGGPSSIGEALTDKIGTYFNTVGLAEQVNGKRSIRFETQGLIDLKTSAVNLPKGALPIESGLKTFFDAARG